LSLSPETNHRIEHSDREQRHFNKYRSILVDRLVAAASVSSLVWLQASSRLIWAAKVAKVCSAANGFVSAMGEAAQQRSLNEVLEDEEQVKRIARHLHSTIPLREAVQVNKRVNYFRGKKLIDVLLNGEKLRNLPVCENEADAKRVGLAMLQMGLIHASEVGNKQRRELKPILRTPTSFDTNGYYTWLVEGSKTMRNLLLFIVVAAIAAMCLFPVWPQSAKKGIWYVSVTLLLLLFLLLTVRLVVYIIVWSIGFEFWILPNFFDDDLGVVDSFFPLWSFERGSDLRESWYFRLGVFAGLLSFGYWCTQQPTDFDEFYAQQLEFFAELYDGKLLADKPADMEKEGSIAAMLKNIPKIEDLEKELMEEEDDNDDEERPKNEEEEEVTDTAEMN